MAIIRRDTYLERLIAYRGNGTVKVVTGIRRCGKTYLLFKLFRNHLRTQGIADDHVMEIRLDLMRDLELRDPKRLYDHVMGRIHDADTHYVLIDEVQEAISADEFRDITYRRPLIFAALNDFLAEGNLEVYVTGSNSRFLSTDVMTEFRDRGTEVRLHPLTFLEYLGAVAADPRDAFDDYLVYGGMPRAVLQEDETERRRYLDGLFEGTYRRDIVERYGIRKVAEMDALVSFLASNVGNLTSARNIARDLRADMGSDIAPTTVISYLKDLSESFIVDAAPQSSIRGRALLKPRYKYYFEDVGLRNARLKFAQRDRSQILENVVYTELVARGLDVAIGRLDIWDSSGEKPRYRNLECDFVARRDDEKAYIQVAWSIDDPTVERRERRPLLAIDDGYPKVIVVGDRRGRYRDSDGLIIIGAIDFLLDEHSI